MPNLEFVFLWSVGFPSSLQFRFMWDVAQTQRLRFRFAWSVAGDDIWDQGRRVISSEVNDTT